MAVLPLSAGAPEISIWFVILSALAFLPVRRLRGRRRNVARHAPAFHYPAQLEDVRAGLAFLRVHAAEFQGDPERIALIGRSSGAHLALLSAYQPDIHVRAVVSFYGPTDLTRGYWEVPSPDP